MMKTLLMIMTLLVTTTTHAAPPSLEDRAATIALAAACGDADECRVLRAGEARRVATIILDSCGIHIPRAECLTLVATLAESRMNASPTCSSARCRKRCGSSASGRARKCRVVCASGRGERAVHRALSCNDGGTSFGWFQMKRALTRRCDDADPHDLQQAARCYASHVAKSHRKNVCRIRNDRQRWAVSFARIAAGHSVTATLVDGTRTSVRRCRPHRYARRAMKHLRGEPRLKGPRAVNPLRVASP